MFEYVFEIEQKYYNWMYIPTVIERIEIEYYTCVYVCVKFGLSYFVL